MHTYAFLLGTHPIISLAETLNYLNSQKIEFGEYHWLNSVLIIDLDLTQKEAAKLQDQLGGVVKIFVIKNKFKGKLFEAEKVLTTEMLLKDFFAQKQNKINFGISVYADPEPSYAELNWLKNFAHKIKQTLKTEHSIRYVEDGGGWNLSSVQVERNRLIDTGAEIALIRDGEFYHIGKTLTVQDYRGYSERDWDKPAPDAKSGMLPPKLAQMMVNLGRDKKTKTIFDPFCGSGIISQEALLLGLKTYGSDISTEAMSNTTKNLEWFTKLKKINIKVASYLKQADATKIIWDVVNKSDTVVVTEPYLGPALKRAPLGHQAKQVVDELTDLYLGFFKNLSKNFNEIGRICIVFPVIKSTEGLKYLDILDTLVKLGYKSITILPEQLTKKDSGLSHRGGFLYSRQDQFVLREIFIFEKVK